MPHIVIPVDHPSFAGHFPGQPILPGVLLLDRVMAAAQAHLPQTLGPFSLSNVKFLAPIFPGNTINVQIIHASSGDYKFTVHAVQDDGQDGVLACTGQLRVPTA
jgi:3-hydroxyacyl-[acyl-carrier-protein] dehydratase